MIEPAEKDTNMTDTPELAVLDDAAEPESGHTVAGEDERRLPGVTTEWPRTDSGRLICTPDRPMPEDARTTFGGSALWQHSDVEDIGECSDGCCDRMRFALGCRTAMTTRTFTLAVCNRLSSMRGARTASRSFLMPIRSQMKKTRRKPAGGAG
jgi:hypothetical protein